MPTYDYICTACGHELEVVHGIHGHGPSACPDCGGRMRKGFAAPAVHFKGSGWAKKDRGAAATTKAAAKAGGGEADATSKKHDRHGDASSSGSGDKGGKDAGSGESASTAAASPASTPTITAGTD